MSKNDGKIITKEVYSLLVSEKETLPIATQYFNKLLEKTINWTEVFTLKYKMIKEQRLVSFSYKLLNNILAVPKNLHKWKIYETPVCNMCFMEGTLSHSMLKCSYFGNFYQVVISICNVMGLENLHFDENTLICGYKPFDKSYLRVNQLIMIIYFTVYKTGVQFRNGNRYNPLNTFKLVYNLSGRMKNHHI